MDSGFSAELITRCASDTAPWSHLKHGKHRLSYIEGMSPVVVGHRTIVLLHGQHPPVEYLSIVIQNTYATCVAQSSKCPSPWC